MHGVAESLHTFHDGAAGPGGNATKSTRSGRASNELPLLKRTGECLRRDEANRVDTEDACTLDIALRVVDKHALLGG